MRPARYRKCVYFSRKYIKFADHWLSTISHTAAPVNLLEKKNKNTMKKENALHIENNINTKYDKVTGHGLVTKQEAMIVV